MIRKFMMLGILAIFLITATHAFAGDVFVTQKGSKYHKEICRLVKNRDNLAKMDKDEAIENDYLPCKRCFKEDVVTDAEQSKQNETNKNKKEKLG